MNRRRPFTIRNIRDDLAGWVAQAGLTLAAMIRPKR